MTFKEYCIYKKNLHTPLPIDPIIPFANEYTFLQEYRSDFQEIDDYMAAKYGDIIFTESDSPTVIEALITGFLKVNTYKYTTLYNSTKFDYNPIWNVDGTEVTEVESAQRKHTDVNGKHERIDTMGARRGETSYGAGTDSYQQTNDVTGFNSTSFANDTMYDGSTTHGEYTDESSSDQYIDKHEEAAYTDTHTEDAFKDTTTVTRSGNIGVTSTQSLIEQERRVAYFSFIERLFADIVRNCTTNMYKED